MQFQVRVLQRIGDTEASKSGTESANNDWLGIAAGDNETR